MKISTVVDYLERFFPFAIQESWDRSGLQIGSLDNEVTRVLISLNCDLDVVNQAIENNCELLITHHPFLLNKLSNYATESSYTQLLTLALKHQLTIVSFHTCLDKGTSDCSMNHWLISKLPVSDIKNYDELQIGKWGVLDQVYDFNAFTELVKSRFGLSYVRTNNLPAKKITTVAICGGSGFDDIAILKDKVDCLISGDCKYHQAQQATENNLALIDASHHLEVVMEQEVANLLEHFDIDIFQADNGDYLQLK